MAAIDERSAERIAIMMEGSHFDEETALYWYNIYQDYGWDMHDYLAEWSRIDPVFKFKVEKINE